MIERPIAIINIMDRPKYIYEDLIKSICHEYRIVRANSDKNPRIIPVIDSLINRFFVFLSTIFPPSLEPVCNGSNYNLREKYLYGIILKLYKTLKS